MRKPIWVGFVSVIVLAFICAGIHALTERGDVAEATLSQVNTIVGVDANPAGNTATSLGTINGCISVNYTGNPSTDTFYIDLFVKDVTNLNQWDGTFRFDESMVHVNSLAVDGFFLGSSGWPILDCYEDPDGNEGMCQVSNFDTTGAGHSGSGVLGRLELTAIGPGISKANFDLRPDGSPISGVQLLDPDGSAVGPVDEYGYFDGSILNAQIAVDEPCPGECLPDVDTDGDGFDDDVECYLPTDQSDNCPDVIGADDAWPLDIDRSTDISVTGDVFSFVGRIGTKSGPSVYCPGPLSGNWWQRLDLNMSCDISVTGDVLKYIAHVGQKCS